MNPSPPPSFLILGAGPAGLGAAAQLKEADQSFHLYERQTRPLGRCKSHDISGIFFDEGPHISFSKSIEVQKLFAENTKNEFLRLKPHMSNYWKGTWIPHPVQSHLAFLPEEMKTRILGEMEALPSESTEIQKKIESFDQWLCASFGRTFYEEFSGIYTKKYWTTNAKNLTTEWVGNRISRPDLNVIREGAATKREFIDHYFTEFRYPKESGYQAFLAPSAERFKDQITLSASVTAIHPKKKWVEINGTERIHYEHLISSIPLDLIPSLLIDAPKDLEDCAEQLNCSSVTLYNILFRAQKPNHDHFAYVYDQDIPFARYYFPKTLIGREEDSVQGVQAEVYHSRFRPRNPQIDNAEKVLEGFERMKLFSRNEVIDVHTQSIRHANVIFDHGRAAARARIFAYLEQHQIYGVGRYGSWRYLWSDESYLDGKSTVRKILNWEGNKS